ncbi:MAG: hypothetical protein HQM12_17560 [SAR324 cluster bacterium]|nr:hypothetical protein [SAR324 cluster bacterium]
MALDPYAKQQLRKQAEVSVEEICRWQNEVLKVASEYAKDVIVRQYQTFNKVECKRRNNKAKRKNQLNKWKNNVDRSLGNILGFTPLAQHLPSIQPLLDLPIKGIDFVEDRIDQVIFERIDHYLGANRVVVDKLIEQAFQKLGTYQQAWGDKVKEQLASKFPVTEEEHLALARDITHLVRRLDLIETSMS